MASVVTGRSPHQQCMQRRRHRARGINNIDDALTSMQFAVLRISLWLARDHACQSLPDACPCSACLLLLLPPCGSCCEGVGRFLDTVCMRCARLAELAACLWWTAQLARTSVLGLDVSVTSCLCRLERVAGAHAMVFGWVWRVELVLIGKYFCCRFTGIT